MFITPDLKQNILYAVYFTITHNIPVIIYGLGIFISAVLAIKRPSRSLIFFLLGFILLLFGYEYQKHILDGLREQTINALITVQEHNKVRRIINLVLIKGAPILLPLVGWMSVGFGAFLFKREKGAKK